MTTVGAEKHLHGDWRITSTEVWDRDALDLVRPAFIRFEDDHVGGFGMIAIQGGLHWYYGERDGRPLVEWTWEGEDEGDLRSGRGWAVLGPDDMLRGRMFIHLGDDTAFVAERVATGGTTAALRRQRRR